MPRSTARKPIWAKRDAWVSNIMIGRFGFLLVSASVLAGASAAADAAPVPTPGMTGPLLANQDPTTFHAGPFGDVYVTGAATGLAFYQDNVAPGDRGFRADIANGQVFIQKTDGVVQFFVQAGVYSMPDLGTPYLRATKATSDFYGALPQAFIKIAPTDTFSIMAGKLPTLIGAEYTFSFENMNIERPALEPGKCGKSRRAGELYDGAAHNCPLME